MRDPKSLIAQIRARLDQERARYTYSAADAAPFAFRFFASWTPPQRGSLPKRLPDDLFAEQAP
jgi:hypothetical protein